MAAGSEYNNCWNVLLNEVSSITLGVGLFLTLPLWGLAVVFAVVLVLHYVAETTTFSRVIERSPALRRFDQLGRGGRAKRRIDPSGPL